MWGNNSPTEIAAAVNNWHSNFSQIKGAGFSPITTARGVMFHALKFGLISSADVSAFDKQQKSDRGKRSYISNKIRQEVLLRDGNQCLLCGNKDKLTVAHITPISRGGNSDVENLQTLCFSCQKSNHGSSVDFRKPYEKQWCSNCGRAHYQNVKG